MNHSRTVAGLDLGSQWVGEKLIIGFILVSLQRSIEDRLERGRGGRWRRRHLRHRIGQSESLKRELGNN
jgi:hypothetical protein